MGGPEIVILMAAATAVQAYGQYQQGKQAQAQAKAQAAWNLYNSKVAKRQAEAEQRAATFESKQAKRKAETILARQRALIGASGVEMEGSPLLVAEDTAAELATELTNIRLTGERRVQTFRSQSILDVSKASAAKTKAAGYGRAAVISAGSSLLQGGAQAGYMGYQMGVFE
jgi:purine-nucleoside phosphorylase